MEEKGTSSNPNIRQLLSLQYQNGPLLSQTATPQSFVYYFLVALKPNHVHRTSQVRICRDSFTCCRTELEVTDQTCFLHRSKCIDKGPASPRFDPVSPSKLALQWLPCHASVVIGSALGPVGLVPVICDWAR